MISPWRFMILYRRVHRPGVRGEGRDDTSTKTFRIRVNIVERWLPISRSGRIGPPVDLFQTLHWAGVGHCHQQNPRQQTKSDIPLSGQTFPPLT